MIERADGIALDDGSVRTTRRDAVTHAVHGDASGLELVVQPVRRHGGHGQHDPVRGA